MPQIQKQQSTNAATLPLTCEEKTVLHELIKNSFSLMEYPLHEYEYQALKSILGKIS